MKKRKGFFQAFGADRNDPQAENSFFSACYSVQLPSLKLPYLLERLTGLASL